jgi:hypothetical protein
LPEELVDQGLKSGRSAIRFRRILPLAALLLVTAFTYRYIAFPRVTHNGPFGMRTNPRARPLTIAQAVNLPAFALTLPLELALFGPRRDNSAGAHAFSIVEFSVLGIIFWFFVGRFVDDFLAWRRLRSGSRWRLLDCLVAAFIAVESTLLLAVFTFIPLRDFQDMWLISSSIGWAGIGYFAFTFRVVQFRAYPRGGHEQPPEPEGESRETQEIQRISEP